MSENTNTNVSQNALTTRIQKTQDTVALIKVLVENKAIPATWEANPERALQAIEYGAALDMSPIVALQNIEFIQGNISIKSKMIPGLLAKKNIALRVVRDCEPVFEKRRVPVMTLNPQTKKEEPLRKDGEIVYKKDDNGEYLTVDVAVDHITEVEFIRNFPEIGVVKNVIAFKRKWAEANGWMTKKNWQENLPYMMMARCITRGARIVASDIIGGLYDELEMADVSGVEVSIED